jgi:hypothetical protein
LTAEGTAIGSWERPEPIDCPEGREPISFRVGVEMMNYSEEVVSWTALKEETAMTSFMGQTTAEICF